MLHKIKISLILNLLVLFTACGNGDFSDPFAKKIVEQNTLNQQTINERSDTQQAAAKHAGVKQTKHILFGDTHVHTTYSADAFQGSLPLMHGANGAYPPAAACDYARFVSQLDFYFLTDHAESYTPDKWRDQVESIRQCAQVSGTENPDLIPFIGFEWTQVGFTANDHYGHHNVLFKNIEEGAIPSRPIAAAGISTRALRSKQGRINKLIYLLDPNNISYYAAYNDFNSEMQETLKCKEDIHSQKQMKECFDTAKDPGELYQKLDEWGFDTMVIPHGTAWGSYTPPGASWEHQLVAKNHDPDKGRLIEIYSGHGTSEKYKNWQARIINKDGTVTCPAPQKDYLPACWQAGEIIRKRCLNNESIQECENRAQASRQLFVNDDTIAAWWTVPGTTEADWLDAAQARDLQMPAFNYRPKKSVQYGLALRNFDDKNNPLRNTWGIIASTDTHSARAGHGFKQTQRKNHTDAKGLGSEIIKKLIAKDKGDAKQAYSIPLPSKEDMITKIGYAIMENERRQSFLTLGGIAAVHSTERSRDGIWDAMKRKEVYGTTGHRMLVWFDLLNAKNGSVPMGSTVDMNDTPKFKVTAIGSFKQLNGCPDSIYTLMDKTKADKLANGECYYPSDKRYNIERIEIVRIRPQNFSGENINKLVDDKWKVFTCPTNSTTCILEFEDAEFNMQKRDTVYYARIFEEPIATINSQNLRTKFNKEDNPISVNPCHGDVRLALTDNCKAPAPQRAWSSPIFVNFN